MNCCEPAIFSAVNCRENMMKFFLVVSLAFVCVAGVKAQILTTSSPLNLTGLSFQFSPSAAELGPIYQGYKNEVNITFPLCGTNYTSFNYSIDVKRVLLLEEFTVKPPTPEQPCHQAHAKMFGRTVGLATITMNVVYKNPDENNPCQKELLVTTGYPVSVPRAPKLELSIFKYGTIFFLVILNFGFGCTLNLDIVKSILRRPIAPAVGFSCQYILMPLVSICKCCLHFSAF